MFEVQVLENVNIFPHFLELIAPQFPIRNFQILQKNGILDLSFKTQQCSDPILTIYLLQISSYEVYKSNARSKVLSFIDHHSKHSMIVYFPSLHRVDEKVNKLFLQTYDIICADLAQLKGYPKDKIQKVILHDMAIELNKEFCIREFIEALKAQIQLEMMTELQTIDLSLQEQYLTIHETGFSFYKLFQQQYNKAQLLQKLNLKQDALNIYLEFEDFFMTEYVKRSVSMFNSMHPFDFLAKKQIQQLIQVFEESGDESQSTVLDFLILIQYRIIDLLAVLSQSQCLEKVLYFVKRADQLVELQIGEMMKSKSQVNEEVQYWRVGLLIWQYANIQNSLSILAQVPQNLTGQLFQQFQYNQLKVRIHLLSLCEQIGQVLFEIQFQVVKSMDLNAQCCILEGQIQNQVNPIQLKDQILTREVKELPSQHLQTYLLSDTKLKGQIHTLSMYMTFYNQLFQDVINTCKILNLKKVQFENEYNLLKLKNTYPQLAFHQDSLTNITSQEFKSDTMQQLHASLLINKLIYMHRENMQLSFKECFQEAMQSSIPGHYFTKYFALLQFPLTKLKDVYFGYFEHLQLEQRQSYYEYQFSFNVLKYLAVECDGVFHITLKAKGVGKDRKKLKLSTQQVELRGQRKQSFQLMVQLNGSQRGNYTIQKVVFVSGSFKLYLVVSQNITQIRYQILYPTIQLQNNTNISNTGTPFALIVSDVPLEDKSFVLSFTTTLKLSYQLKSIYEEYQITQDNNNFTITCNNEFHIHNPFILIAIGFEDTSPMPFNVRLQIANKTYNYETQIRIHKCIDVQDLSDQVDGKHKLYEISNISDLHLSIKNPKQELELKDGDSLRQLILTDQSLYIRSHHELPSEYIELYKSLDEHALSALLNPWQSIEYLQNEKHTHLDIHKLKAVQSLFKIQIISVFQQEQSTPYQAAQYFNIILKIQYLGVNPGDYQIKLASNQVKGDRGFQYTFTPTQTICVKDFICFLTSDLDYEKPDIKIYLIQDESIQIDPQSIDIDFQMQIDEVQQQ